MPASGIFRARFSILSTTGDAFSTLGVGDDARHYYVDATKTGSINLHLFGNCYYLDGSITPISFAGLPVGFTPSGNLILSSPQSVIGGGFFNVLQVPADATGHLTLTYGIYGPKTITVTGFLLANDVVLIGANDLIALLTIQCAITHVALFGNEALVFDSIDISGNYVITKQEFAIENPTVPIRAGDKVKITSVNGLLTGVEQIQVNGVIVDSSYIIIQQPFSLWFYLPPEFVTFSGLITVTLVGDGVQFSGSVVAGVLQILSEDATGIYELVKGQTNDVLYTRDGYATDLSLLMLPSMLEDEPYEDDFFSLLAYPYRILADDDYQDDITNFNLIATQRFVIVPLSVEIPSPFIKTAFLP